MGWTEQDSKNLERIADVLELLLSKKGNMESNVVYPNSYFEAPLNNIESEFFRNVMQVYHDEEKLIEERGGGKKSPVRVAKWLNEYYADTFMEKIHGIEIDTEKGGLLIFKRGEKVVCALKVYTDLGYGRRGVDGYKDMKHFTEQAAEYGVTPDRVFFLIISFRNGLDNEHVKALLDMDISNKELLEKPNLLKEYAKRYVNNAGTYLPNPSEQIYFLASDSLHPNVLEEAYQVNLNEYHWLRPSVTELINKIKSL